MWPFLCIVALYAALATGSLSLPYLIAFVSRTLSYRSDRTRRATGVVSLRFATSPNLVAVSLGFLT